MALTFSCPEKFSYITSYFFFKITFRVFKRKGTAAYGYRQQLCTNNNTYLFFSLPAVVQILTATLRLLPSKGQGV